MKKTFFKHEQFIGQPSMFQFHHKLWFCSILLIYLLLFSQAQAVNSTNTINSNPHLTIVSSFPEEMTLLYKKTFEKNHPGIAIKVLHQKTSKGLKYLEDHSDVDLFWVSAPDAFEVLKKKGMLQQYRPRAKGIPRYISGYPVNDPDGFYSGFSAAGYGIMWNNEYLKTHNLTAPKEWIDLTKPEYRGHIGLSAPSRSGTTHLTVETILQLKGWKPGWSLVKSIAANAKVITIKSNHVPRGVLTGEFGIGIVIDFYGLAAKAQGAPVDFTYPTATVLVPASIAILKKSQHKETAKQFIEFLLSSQGQQLLLTPKISRLPLRPETYASIDIPPFFPRPYGAKALGSHTAFDVLKSMNRYNVVNSLFDVMITYRFNDLNLAMQAVQKAEQFPLSAEKSLPKIAQATAQRSRANLFSSDRRIDKPRSKVCFRIYKKKKNS